MCCVIADCRLQRCGLCQYKVCAISSAVMPPQIENLNDSCSPSCPLLNHGARPRCPLAALECHLLKPMHLSVLPPHLSPSLPLRPPSLPLSTPSLAPRALLCSWCTASVPSGSTGGGSWSPWRRAVTASGRSPCRASDGRRSPSGSTRSTPGPAASLTSSLMSSRSLCCWEGIP